MDQNDVKEDPIKITDILAKIERLKKNKINYELLAEKLKASEEQSLIMLVYSIKPTINILGVSDLIAKLKNWKSP